MVTVNPNVSVSTATDANLAEAIANVAAITFPLACPPHSPPDAIADFIANQLSPNNFRGYITRDNAEVLVAQQDSQIIGYCLVLHRDPPDPDVAAVVTARPVSEISKMYVLPDHHGAGASHALMTRAIDTARARKSAIVWLGVNQENLRAQRFYAKMGFGVAGTKTFNLGATIEHDYVMTRLLD
ncbi:GNAT family N-acetyltransferase [Gordonia effusa]|uniref:GNAT family N-acetyltransferase n=1 Tax=Gordonia effusa TaxID=263908 RepID=UPI001FE17621|nr:GNAT family N-acetyltransferase [Gordonia effusa]